MDSTVLMVHAAPSAFDPCAAPLAKATLNIVVQPRCDDAVGAFAVGILTMVSRGIETTSMRVRSAEMCMISVVSLR